MAGAYGFGRGGLFGEAPSGGSLPADGQVLYWDTSTNKALGSADFIFNDTLKTLILKSGGSANIQEWQNSSGTALSLITPAGYFHAPDGANVTPGYSFKSNPDTGMYLSGSALLFSIDGAAKWAINGTSLLYPVTDATHDFGGPSNRVRTGYINTVRGTSIGSSSGDFDLVSAASARWRLLSTGMLIPNGDAQYDLGTSAARVRSGYFGGVANAIPVSIKLNASQTFNAIEVQNSSAVVLAKMDQLGKVYGGGASAGAVAGTPRLLASEAYVQSRLQNLLTNGSLLLGNNYNFTGWTFDPVETHGGGGSIKYTSTGSANSLCDELIPVDTGKTYVLTGWCKNGNADGSEDSGTATQYYLVAPYDADQNPVSPFNYAKHPGSTDTTLAADLNPGDLTITLTDATGWFTGGDYRATIAWWPYTNAKGYTYPNYTYTRNFSYGYAGYGSGGTWAAGGITGNVITLRAPWPGPAVTAGSAVRNSTSGGTYKYIALSGVHVPSTWTKYWGTIGGVDTQGVQLTNRFPYGTAYVKVGFLMNYGGPHPGTGNTVRWSDMTFMESAASLSAGDDGGGTTIAPYPSYTVPGLIDVRGKAAPQYFRIWNNVDELLGNGEYARLGWISNTMSLDVLKSGTGVDRNLLVTNQTNGSSAFVTSGTGHTFLGSYGASGGNTYLVWRANSTIYHAGSEWSPVNDAVLSLGLQATRWKSVFAGGVAASVPYTAKLHASQTANALEIQNSSGTALTVIDKDANLIFKNPGKGLAFGSCYGNEIGVSQAAAQNTWYPISDADMADGHGGLNLMAHDGSGKLTVTNAGRYLLTYAVTLTCDTNDIHIQTGVFVNGSYINDGTQHYEAKASYEGEVGSTAIVALAANGYVEIAVRTTDSGTPTIGVDHLNVTLVQVGG